jgi:hypothetical protein
MRLVHGKWRLQTAMRLKGFAIAIDGLSITALASE